MSNETESKMLAWATDTHLDHIANDPVMMRVFVNQIKDSDCQGLVITGDISNARLVDCQLLALSRGVGETFPIYFVCGNHDFYGGSICRVRELLTSICESNTQLCYLHATDFVPFTRETALVGVDGWYDGLYSPIQASRLLMNDFFLIEELRPLHKFRKGEYVVHQKDGALHQKMQEWAAADAASLTRKVTNAIQAGYKNIVAATHIPPFPQNSVYNGRVSDGDWLPFFSSKLMGDCLLDLADNYPEVHFTVLCGHSHGEAVFTAGRSNLLCRTGKADYGYPRLADILTVK